MELFTMNLEMSIIVCLFAMEEKRRKDNLLHIKYVGLNKVDFVIDTGALITILSKRMAFSQTQNAAQVKLSAANGKDLECFLKHW